MSLLNIVIPIAGVGRRMKSYGPKSLITIWGETVIERQIRILRECYPQARFVAVVGFEADRVQRALPADVRVVVNADYATTNVAKSIELGLRQCEPNVPALIVYGDLVFNHPAVENLPLDRSCAVIDISGRGREQEVGLNVVDGKVMRFSYGLPRKWAHICLLCESEKRLFLRVAAVNYRQRFLGYEILNEIIDGGATIVGVTPPATMRLVEIDSSNDIERARQLIS